MKKYLSVVALFALSAMRLPAQTLPGNSFKGIYFGTFSNGDQFALVVSSSTNTSIFIIGTASNSVGSFTNFSIGSSGGFAISQDNTSIVATISNGVLTGTVPQKGETLSGSLTSQIGSSQTYQGYYFGIGHDPFGNQVECFFVVASNGKVIYYQLDSTGANGAVGSVDSLGNLTLTSAAGVVGSGAFSTPVQGGGYSGNVNVAGIGDITFYVGRGDATYKLTNISTRGIVGTGGGILIAGFVITGGARTVLIRASGPALTAFGVTGVLADPQLSIFDSSSNLIGGNNGWSNSTTSVTDLTRIFNYMGAFAFQAGSNDSAVVLNLEPGSYTAQVSGVGNTTGVALVEVYDAD
jgi:hypothetical protein